MRSLDGATSLPPHSPETNNNTLKSGEVSGEIFPPLAEDEVFNFQTARNCFLEITPNHVLCGTGPFVESWTRVVGGDFGLAAALRAAPDAHPISCLIMLPMGHVLAGSPAGVSLIHSAQVGKHGSICRTRMYSLPGVLEMRLDTTYRSARNFQLYVWSTESISLFRCWPDATGFHMEQKEVITLFERSIASVCVWEWKREFPTRITLASGGILVNEKPLSKPGEQHFREATADKQVVFHHKLGKFVSMRWKHAANAAKDNFNRKAALLLMNRLDEEDVSVDGERELLSVGGPAVHTQIGQKLFAVAVGPAIVLYHMLDNGELSIFARYKPTMAGISALLPLAASKDKLPDYLLVGGVDGSMYRMQLSLTDVSMNKTVTKLGNSVRAFKRIGKHTLIVDKCKLLTDNGAVVMREKWLGLGRTQSGRTNLAVARADANWDCPRQGECLCHGGHGKRGSKVALIYTRQYLCIWQPEEVAFGIPDKLAICIEPSGKGCSTDELIVHSAVVAGTDYAVAAVSYANEDEKNGNMLRVYASDGCELAILNESTMFYGGVIAAAYMRDPSTKQNIIFVLRGEKDVPNGLTVVQFSWTDADVCRHDGCGKECGQCGGGDPLNEFDIHPLKGVDARNAVDMVVDENELYLLTRDGRVLRCGLKLASNDNGSFYYEAEHCYVTTLAVDWCFHFIYGFAFVIGITKKGKLCVVCCGTGRPVAELGGKYAKIVDSRFNHVDEPVWLASWQRGADGVDGFCLEFVDGSVLTSFFSPLPHTKCLDEPPCIDHGKLVAVCGTRLDGVSGAWGRTGPSESPEWAVAAMVEVEGQHKLVAHRYTVREDGWEVCAGNFQRQITAGPVRLVMSDVNAASNFSVLSINDFTVDWFECRDGTLREVCRFYFAEGLMAHMGLSVGSVAPIVLNDAVCSYAADGSSLLVCVAVTCTGTPRTGKMVNEKKSCVVPFTVCRDDSRREISGSQLDGLVRTDQPVVKLLRTHCGVSASFAPSLGKTRFQVYDYDEHKWGKLVRGGTNTFDMMRVECAFTVRRGGGPGSGGECEYEVHLLGGRHSDGTGVLQMVYEGNDETTRCVRVSLKAHSVVAVKPVQQVRVWRHWGHERADVWVCAVLTEETSSVRVVYAVIERGEPDDSDNDDDDYDYDEEEPPMEEFHDMFKLECAVPFTSSRLLMCDERASTITVLGEGASEKLEMCCCHKKTIVNLEREFSEMYGKRV